MPSKSRFRIVAVVLGGLLGTSVAWFHVGEKTNERRPVPSVSPRDTTSQAPSANATTLSRSTQTERPRESSRDAEPLPTNASSVASNASASVEDNDTDTPYVAVFSRVAWTAPVDVKRAENGCISGEALDCLGLGELYLSKSDGALAKNRSQDYFERAFSLLVLRCHRREPDACVTIARMHHLRRGIRKNVETEAALVTRAKELCRSKPGKVCSTFSN
jgi:hypothetical protein